MYQLMSNNVYDFETIVLNLRPNRLRRYNKDYLLNLSMKAHVLYLHESIV